MIRPITDELFHRLVEHAKVDRIDRPGDSAATCRRSKCDPDHLLRAEDGREVVVVE
ncbi:hypothetical protein ACFVYE_42360 [Streptomyces sp. NPDC058239]|uniref:hypothetical protein n=1 Tax=unclassified Streptomyces TaxID=2593676 RepID=UPI00365201F3